MKSLSQLCAKAALFNDQNQVLVLRRSKTDKKRPGGLDFPGGGLDPGEGPDEAVVREIEEEIGLSSENIHDLQVAYTDTNFYKDESAIRFLYVGKITGNQELTLSYEHDEYYWMSVEEAIEKFDHLVWAKGLRYALEHDLLQ